MVFAFAVMVRTVNNYIENENLGIHQLLPILPLKFNAKEQNRFP